MSSALPGGFANMLFSLVKQEIMDMLGGLMSCGKTDSFRPLNFYTKTISKHLNRNNNDIKDRERYMV